MAELIQREDSLNTGREKLNEAIKASDRAEQKSDQAVNTSNEAKSQSQSAENKANSVQEQFNQVVIEGDSSVEAAQARVDAEGNTYDTLKERLDDKETEFSSQLAETMKHLKFVTYDLFGVDGRKKYYNPNDGEYYLDEEFTQIYTVDDGIKIKECHEFANDNNLPVIQLAGEYVIKDTRNIPVLTNTDFGYSIFHIDESKTPLNDGQVFSVQSENKPFTLNDIPYSTILPYMKKGVKYIPPLENYKNHFVIVENTNKKYYRTSSPPKSHNQEEFFYIDEGGKLVGDIAWDFDTITNITLIKCDEGRLKINGGVFLLSGNLNYTNIYGEYKSGGIRVERSRVMIENQFVGLDGGGDTATAASSGFYTFTNCYDVTLNTVRLIPRKNIVVNGSSRGTYGIGGSRALKLTLNDVIANGTNEYWGVMGTNQIKDLVVSNSQISRVDVHFHAWNVRIYNCDIGEGGITLSGGGMLNIENTTVTGNFFCSFRQDYGCQWDGDVIIKSGKLKVSRAGGADILAILPLSGDYGYPVKLAERIFVENFVFDYHGVTTESNANLVRFNTVKIASNERISYPSYMKFKDVVVVGREKGCQLLNISGPHELRSRKKAIYHIEPNSVEITPNCEYIFENVQTTDPKTVLHPGSNGHIWVVNTGADYQDDYSLVPLIRIIDCENLRIGLNASIIKLEVENSSIASLNSEASGIGRANITIDKTNIIPSIVETNPAFRFNNCELTMINSKILPYKTVSGSDDMVASVSKTGLYEMTNSYYRTFGRYVNTRLSKKIVDHLDNTFTEDKTSVLLEKLQFENPLRYSVGFYLPFS